MSDESARRRAQLKLERAKATLAENFRILGAALRTASRRIRELAAAWEEHRRRNELQ